MVIVIHLFLGEVSSHLTSVFVIIWFVRSRMYGRNVRFNKKEITNEIKLKPYDAIKMNLMNWFQVYKSSSAN